MNSGLKDPTNPGTSVASTNTWSNGYYLQDSWTIANVLTLNFGVRLDTQTMKNDQGSADGSDHAAAQHQRHVGAARPGHLGLHRHGPRQIQGNWGMYYEAIPLDMALRAFGGETQVRGFYQLGYLRREPQPARQPLGQRDAELPERLR